MQNVGRLNKRLRLEVNEEIRDSGGGYEDNWVKVATVWANRKPLTSSEFLTAQQSGASITHKIIIRNRDINKDMRLMEGKRIFSIDHYRELDENGRYLQIFVTEEAFEDGRASF